MILKNSKFLSFVLIGIIITSIPTANGFLPLTPGQIIIQNIINQNNAKQGTYNQTQANNVVVNSGGYQVNFKNGTGATVLVENSHAGKQVNVTISAGAGSGVNSLNALTGALTIACVSGNTTCTTSGGNTITINTAWNIVTTGGLPQTITKGVTLNSLTLGGQMNLAGNTFLNTGTITFPTTTGTLAETSQLRTYQNNTGTNLGTSGIGPYASNSGSVLQFLRLICVSVGCTFTSNSTNIILTLSGFSDTNTAQVTNIGTENGLGLQSVRTNQTNNNLRSITCGAGLACSNNATNTRINSTALTSAITSLNSNSAAAQTIAVTSPVTIAEAGATHTIGCSTCLTSSSGGTTQTLSTNQTCTSTSNFCHVWNIALTANSGNAIHGLLLATSDTAGGAVQVGANMTNITHGQGRCTFSYASVATTLTTFDAGLAATSSDSAWTTLLASVGQPFPIYFDCAVTTDASPPTLQINFQAEVASTVAIKAGSYYIKTP